MKHSGAPQIKDFSPVFPDVNIGFSVQLSLPSRHYLSPIVTPFSSSPKFLPL